MTETISGTFDSLNQAEAAIAELEESGVSESELVFDSSSLVVTVRVDINIAISVRTIIERHGGRTDVDDIPDVGTIPDDPLHFSEEAEPGEDWAGR